MLTSIKDKISAQNRISDQDFLRLEAEADLFELGTLASSIRKKKHPDSVVTYVVDRNINYTDICVSACKFCAFFKAPEDGSGYLLEREELRQKIVETQELGGTQILLQGGLHPDLIA